MRSHLAGVWLALLAGALSTTKYDNNPQITCAKAVPSGKELEMCRLTSGGDKFVKLSEGRADCLRLSNPSAD